MGNRISVPAWQDDWKSRIDDRVRSLGYKDFLHMLESNPGVPYSELAHQLSKNADVAPVQLEMLHAELLPGQHAAMIDSLARFLRGSLHRGWGKGTGWESRVIGSLASWSVMWGGGVKLRRMKAELFRINPPEGWVPESGGDPILARLKGLLE